MSNNFVFPPSVRNEFAQYLRDNPNRRRISRTEEIKLIDWLTHATTQPQSQRESSRRHYAKKTFAWNAKEQTLIALPSGSNAGPGNSRNVVTEDGILEKVEMMHGSNGHAGWDATWKDISSAYYGILRADVIFLLKRCHVCAQDPRKRPKGLPSTLEQSETAATTSPCCLKLDDLLHEELTNDPIPSVGQPQD